MSVAAAQGSTTPSTLWELRATLHGARILPPGLWAEFFSMSDDEGAVAAGLRPAPLVEVSGPLQRCLRQGNEKMALSLDVLALQMVEELGPQAPGWVLSVPVPLIRETTRNNKEESPRTWSR